MDFRTSSLRIRSIVVFFLAFASSTVAAQDKYPSKAVHLVTSGSPGTQLDALARVYADQLARRIGQQVVVDNKPGAGGTIASQFIATARPDGYAFEIVSNAQAINATLYQNLPYDTVRDFAGIALVAESPAVLVVPPSLGLHTLKEFIALAKEKPDTVNYGSGGVGTATHISTEFFAEQAKIRMVHVPYKAINDMISDLMTGRIQLNMTPVASNLGNIRGGKMVALAVTSRERVPALPEVPTVQEAAGLPGFEYATWFGMVAPSQTPKPVLELLSRELRVVNEQPDVKERLDSQAILRRYMPPAEFDAYMRSEIEKMGRIVRATGAKAN